MGDAMMKQRMMLALAAGALMVTMLPGAASSDDPVGGCPKGTFNVPHPAGGGWTLMPVTSVIPGADRGNYKDRNGDGWICQRFVIGQSKKHGFGVWVVKDNTKPWGRYRVIPENGVVDTWAGAKAHCESLGAHLVTINSAKEDRAVSRLVQPQPAWIGATDEDQEGVWVWVTREPFTYTNWSPGEPNDADGEDYAAYNSSGTWIDQPGWVGMPSVCEYE